MLSLVLLSLLACRSDPADSAGSSTGDGGVEIGPFEARIRWTSYGIPHIQAQDYGSLGYGMGYAFARDHACVLADQLIMVKGERSRWFGEDYVDHDFGWRALHVQQDAAEGFSELSPHIQDALVGYAAGYNRWLEEGTLDPRCAGAAWVQPIDHLDLLAYYLALGLYGSGLVLVDSIGSGVPPTASAADSRGGPLPLPPGPEVFEPLLHPVLGSNGWAIGADRSASGGGMLLSNTHFPAEGERKWHESHLVIPGELDVYGASLMGVPVINLGFNGDVAWTHTVSNAPRFTAALLRLDPADPTRYEYDGGYLDMSSQDYSIEVLRDDGSLETVTRTLWTSHWGPVLNAPVMGWTDSYALAMTDANSDNLAMFENWFAMNRATDMDDFKRIHEEIGGIPWVHTMAVDKTGRAFYIDSSSVPNWSAEAEARYPEWLAEESLAALFHGYGVITVDGSDPVFEWVEEPGAWRPGLVPYADMPKLERSDFVYNANDNHWLSNPAQPLEGYPYLYGSERTPRTPRTRMNARYLAETGAGSASGEDGLFTFEELQAAAAGGRGMVAEELLDQVLAHCQANPTATLSGSQVDITPACSALAQWDGTARTDQVGPPVWRELLGSGFFDTDDLLDAGGLFTVPFDADDPIDTPTGLNTQGDLLAAMARAQQNLAEAGLQVDATLGQVQFMRKDGRDLPVPGGQFIEGTIAIAEYSSGNATLLPVESHGEVVNSDTDLTVDGYQMNYGNSFVLTVELTEAGVQAGAVMTYSQSDDPSSPHFDDQTALYEDGSFRPVRYTEEEIAGDVIEELVLTLP